MAKKSYELKDLIIDACDTYDEQIEHYDDENDAVHEIADGAVPIYYYDIGQYAAHNRWLMTETPEINPNGNVYEQIQANIYQAICEGLYEHIDEKENKDK
jgi:hypothetical protein